MPQQRFSVIFGGRVQDGMDPRAVEQRLSSEGFLTPEDIDRLHSGKPAVLVSGVTHDRALQYQATLEVAGAHSRVVPSQEEPSIPQTLPESVTVELPAEPPMEKAAPDLDTPDLSIPELDEPVFATHELAPPELAVPELVVPDPAPPELATPEAATPELATPQLDAPDLGLPDEPAQATVPEASVTRMTCPKCGFEQAESAECVACGIVVSKFLQRQKDRGSSS